MIGLMIMVKTGQAVPQMAAMFFVTPVVVMAPMVSAMIVARLLQHIEK